MPAIKLIYSSGKKTNNKYRQLLNYISRQVNIECSPFSQPAGSPDEPIVILCDFLAKRQPYAGTGIILPAMQSLEE